MKVEEIDTHTKEGQLLVICLGKLMVTKEYRDKTAGEIFQELEDINKGVDW
jgi:hypothetical protein